ncbi:hypothetical protein [Falsiroseomonas tokyonensis]|nr:hypothetical protein [Falsiroseomonas tokyonensis]
MAGSARANPATEAPDATASGEAPLQRPTPRRRDPFAHGALPVRPTFLPEEAEPQGSRSEIWAILKGLVVAVAVIFFLGWMLTQR